MRKQGADTFGSTKQLLCRKSAVAREIILTAVFIVYPNASNSGEAPQWCRANKLNVTERTICASSDLQRLDIRMAEAYKRAMTDNKKRDQISWLKERNSCGSDRTCIARTYRDRLATLDSGGAPVASDSARRSHQTAQSSKNRGSSTSDIDGQALGMALGAAAAIGVVTWLFSGDKSHSSSSSSSSSTSSDSYNPKYGCKFCCTGQWGNCKSPTFQVNTPASNLIDAKDYVSKQYEATCKKYPFYGGIGEGTASVGFADCEFWYY